MNTARHFADTPYAPLHSNMQLNQDWPTLAPGEGYVFRYDRHGRIRSIRKVRTNVRFGGCVVWVLLLGFLGIILSVLTLTT